jgi:PIN domain nuclease of toxin-antitoxin system
MLNLDTHVLVHALEGTVTPRERTLLAGSPWSISVIVLWELSKLVQLRRLELDIDAPEIARVLSRIHQWPLDLAVARMSTRLDFGSDPADEIIAATSVVHGVPLVTRDRKIRKSRLVPLA